MVITIHVLLGFVPGFAWLVFYLQEESRPEPKRLIALAFLTGAAVAFIAFAAQIRIRSLLAGLNMPQYSFTGLFLFAACEELLKFAAAYAAVHKSPEFEEPVEAMLYAVVAALGFATVENIGILLGGNPQSLVLANAFHLVTFRFIGATLLHTLASGLVGYYWAMSIRHFGAKRFVLGGLCAASLLHALFNYGILHHHNIPSFSLALLMIAGFF